MVTPVIIVIIILIFECSPLLGVIVIFELDRIQSFVDGIHEVSPDPSGPCCTLKIAHGFGLITADPYRSRVIMCKSAEPAVFGFVSGSGLTSCRHSVVQSEPAARSPAFFQNTLKNAHHLSGSIRVVDLRASAVISIDHFTLIILDPSYAGRRAVFAVVLDRAVSGSHLYGLHTVCKSSQTCSHRIVGIDNVCEMHGLEIFESLSGCDLFINLPGDCVERSLYSFAQLHFAVIAAARVLRSVFDLLILDERAREIASLKSRRVDHQRFDRTSRLAVALECTVERQSRDIILRSSSDHGDNLPRVIVNAYGSSLHLVFSVIRRILEFRKFFIHTLLQSVLHVHIKGRIDLVSAFVELGQAVIVQFIVDVLVQFTVVITGKVISE